MTLQPIHAIAKCLVIQKYDYAAVNKILRKPDNKTANINVKNCRFKHTCNDDAGIGRRKQQKLVYRIFTCM